MEQTILDQFKNCLKTSCELCEGCEFCILSFYELPSPSSIIATHFDLQEIIKNSYQQNPRQGLGLSNTTRTAQIN